MSNEIKFARSGKDGGEIVVYGDIGYDINAKDFDLKLKELGKVSNIHVRLNSFGGDVFDGVTIYNRLMDHGATIKVSIDGMAASAASVIAMAGSERRIGDSAFVMIHDAWVMTMGNAKELMAQARRLEAVSSQIAGIYVKRTGQTMDQVREWMDDEAEFNAEQAIEFGFATATFESEQLAAKAKFNPKRHHFKRTPTILLPKNHAAAQRLVAEARMLQSVS